MIKIKIGYHEATLNGEVWTSDNRAIAHVLNSQTELRPHNYEPYVEHAIASYIVAKHREKYNAEIIYDSNEGQDLGNSDPRITD